MAERLIDVKALKKEKIEARLLDENGLEFLFRGIPFIALETAPTIEAKPVVHAHWEKPNYIDMYYSEVICCSCGKKVLDEHKKEYKFCPFCGAQMDEVVEDG